MFVCVVKTVVAAKPALCCVVVNACALQIKSLSPKNQWDCADVSTECLITPGQWKAEDEPVIIPRGCKPCQLQGVGKGSLEKSSASDAFLK